MVTSRRLGVSDPMDVKPWSGSPPDLDRVPREAMPPAGRVGRLRIPREAIRLVQAAAH